MANSDALGVYNSHRDASVFEDFTVAKLRCLLQEGKQLNLDGAPYAVFPAKYRKGE